MSGPPLEESWLGFIWRSALDDRERDMLARRRSGERLEPIGRSYGVSRERARQVLTVAEERVLSMADLLGGDWREAVAARTSSDALLPEGTLSDVLEDPSGALRPVLLRDAGLCECRTWAGVVPEVWASSEDALDPLLSDLVARGPLRARELREVAATLGIPDAVPLESILTHARSPLTTAANGAWVRRRSKSRDAAYLWLADEGEPRQAAAISEAIEGKSPRVVTEALRRDERFRQLRPEGTWALAEWSSRAATDRHTNALDAMLETLREHGPIGRAQLFALTARTYPVTGARLQQCLISDRIGATPDGLLDLVERGAAPMEEQQPRRPPHMVVDRSGQVVGVRMGVDREVLRGSGVIVHPWLTWYLGLRLAPMSRTFTMEDGSGVMTVRRNTSAAQLSSIRAQVLAADMMLGCQAVVMFRLDSSSVSIKHVCVAGACPRETPRAGRGDLQTSGFTDASPG